jgi:hypothetical protein
MGMVVVSATTICPYDSNWRRDTAPNIFPEVHKVKKNVICPYA